MSFRSPEIDTLEIEARNRVHDDDRLRPYRWVLMIDWGAQPGFALFDYWAYYTWLSFAPVEEILRFAAPFGQRYDPPGHRYDQTSRPICNGSGEMGERP